MIFLKGEGRGESGDPEEEVGTLRGAWDWIGLAAIARALAIMQEIDAIDS